MRNFTRKEVMKFYKGLPAKQKTPFSKSLGFADTHCLTAFLGRHGHEETPLPFDKQELLQNFLKETNMTIELLPLVHNEVINLKAVQQEIDKCKTLEEIQIVSDKLEVLTLRLETKRKEIELTNRLLKTL